MKKIISLLVAAFFVVTLTAASASAGGWRGGDRGCDRGCGDRFLGDGAFGGNLLGDGIFGGGCDRGCNRGCDRDDRCGVGCARGGCITAVRACGFEGGAAGCGDRDGIGNWGGLGNGFGWD
jgi:hypothetical protein